MIKYLILTIISLFFVLSMSTPIYAQNNSQNSSLTRINIPINRSQFYNILYKASKPDDVPQEVYDRLFEIQLE